MAIDVALFKVEVEGKDISPVLAPTLISLSIRDVTGASTDTAQLELDDTGGVLKMPPRGVAIQISLTDLRGSGGVFRGTVDEVRVRGGRSGALMSISAKGADMASAVKELRQRHWDGADLATILDQSARSAGLSGAKVDPAFAGMVRGYVAQHNESFMAFGQRLAREVGGTFKIAGDRAVLLARGGGSNASGVALPTIEARYGVNLLEWEISPDIGRHRYGGAAVRVYDPQTGQFTRSSAAGALSGGVTHHARFPAADAGLAEHRARADIREAGRMKGKGSVTILGDVSARPEATCSLIGARPGIDGDYRITAVEHSLDRGNSVETKLELGEPSGAAGTDSRAATA